MSLFSRQILSQESVEEERWGDAIICQPYESEQILLAENASCLAVKTLLKMLNLEFRVKTYSNAEYMSPGGHRTKLPILCLGAFVISEFEPIATFIEGKVQSLSVWMDEDGKLDMRAYTSLVENIFTNAELYISWLDKSVYNGTTFERYGSVYPWPLNYIQCWRKKQQVLQQLKVFDWRNITLQDVKETVEKLCDTLVDKLGDNMYFYSDSKPSELDALVFGHLFSIITTRLPNNMLAEIVLKRKPLCDYCKRIETKYFPKKK